MFCSYYSFIPGIPTSQCTVILFSDCDQAELARNGFMIDAA